MASLADVLKVSPPPAPAAAGGSAPSDAPGDEPKGVPEQPGDTESQLAQYAWEFHQAKNPDDARDALEAFVRLVTE